MKVAIAQFNPTVGAVADNARHMRDWQARARRAGADVVLFPELCLVGYPPRDLLDRPAFIEQVAAATRALVAEAPPDLTLIFGTLGQAPEGPGLTLTNDAVVARGGVELARVSKRLLPTYDVFDETRHFRPGVRSGRVEVVPGCFALITVCEDLWAQTAEVANRYATRPISDLEEGPVQCVLNLSASPFTLDKRNRRGQIFQELATRYGVDVLVANQVGANDELIFDGSSVAWSAEGKLLGQAKCFEEELLMVELDPRHKRPCPCPPARTVEEDAYAALVLGVRDYVHKCGFRAVVLGLSGGIDSALTAAIAVDALGAEQVTGLAMPARYSSPGSVADALALAHNLGIACHVVDIDPVFQAYIDQLEPLLARLGPADDADVSLENVQARVRGATLMAWSNRSGALVLTTGNKSELAVGYCTLYGDMVGGLAVISDVPKTMVYALSRYVNREGQRIPQSTIDKPPSAELRPDQKDQDSLPPYERLDAIVELYVERHLSPSAIVAAGYDADEVRRVIALIVGAEYKRRQAAPGLILTRKAFGLGRRVPVASRLQEDSGP